MKCASTVVAILVAACGVAHAPGGDDAARGDGGVIHDGGGSDAATCPDVDGDGARDVRCGGDDCDDADPAVGPTYTMCTAPTRVRHCVAGELREDACPAATPDCDARTGACSDNACGDGVVHPDEQCDAPSDPAHCLGGCQRFCEYPSDCADLPNAPMCRADARSWAGSCVASVPGGLPFGAVCAEDTDCFGNYCDPDTRRCTSICDIFQCDDFLPRVSGGTTWCSEWRYDWNQGAERAVAMALPHRCFYSCGTSADCVAGEVCTPIAAITQRGLGPQVVGYCRPPSPSGLPLGAPCMEGSGPRCASNACVQGVCTTPCVIDADCVAPFVRCEEGVASGPDLMLVMRRCV